MAKPEGYGANKKAAFLESLSKTASVTLACNTARLPRRTAYEWRQKDQKFAKAWDDAVESGTDLLEDEMVRRAAEGTVRPIFQKGQRVGEVREYSDLLLIFALKARRPDKFRDRVAIEHDVTDKLAERLEAAVKRQDGAPKG